MQHSAIPRATLDVLRLLSRQEFISNFRLVGGTALAMLWEHRISEDVDFFSDQDVNLDQLEARLNMLPDAIMHSTNPIGRIYSIKEVKCDFLNYPYKFIHPVELLDGVPVAHIDDIVSLKLGAIANRGAKKDFYDLYFILQRYTLDELVELYKRKFKMTDAFSLLKSLSYFDDAEVTNPPILLKEKSLTWPMLKKTIIQTVNSKFN